MKAAYIRKTGPPEVIEFGDLPDPQPGPGQCLVRVSAVSVNPIDTYVRSGMVPARLAFPFILGRDLAGRVIAVGEGVKDFEPGQRVWATSQGTDGRPGTFSELAAVGEEWLNPIPESVSDQDAAALALVGMTACIGLTRYGRMAKGETLFVNGGSGGVGSCVVQMAKALGARVITTAGSDRKAAICRDLGADCVVHYRKEDVVAAIRAFAPEGVHVWWETVREPDFERCIPLMALGGRLIVMAGREARPAFPVGPFYVKDCSLHGFAVFNATLQEQREAARRINSWAASGALKARVDRVLPLSATAEAHRLQEASTIHKTGELTGKIVLQP